MQRQPIIMKVINMTSNSGQPSIPYYEAPVCKYEDRLGRNAALLMEPYNASTPILSAYEVQ